MMSASISNADNRDNRYRGLLRPQKGERPYGRRKGSPNKYNGDIKRMVCAALEGAGGVEYLIGQAHKNPVAFMGLVGRVLPLQVTGADGGKLRVEFSWADAPAAQPAIKAEPVAIDAEIVEDESDVIITFATAEDPANEQNQNGSE